MKNLRALFYIAIALTLGACSSATETPVISDFPRLTVSETPSDTPTTEPISTPTETSEPDDSGKTKLSISLYGSFSVEETRVYKAASEYMRSHPDVFIDFRYTQGNSSMAKHEYNQKTVDDISRGSSADIMFIDALPSPRTFPAVNNLVDFEQLIESDRDIVRSDFFENILDAVEYENGLYMLPIAFYPTRYVMNKEYVHLLEKPFGEYETIDYKTMMAVYEKALSSYSGDDILYLDNTPSNWGNRFMEALDLQALDFESGIANIYNEETYELAEKASKRPLIEGASISKCDYFDFFYSPEVATVFANENAGGGAFIDAYLMYDDFAYSTPMLQSDFSGKNIVFSLNSSVAISKNCAELDTAWDFIKFLIGFDYDPLESDYNLLDFYGIYNPINRKLFEDKWTKDFVLRYEENQKQGRTPKYSRDEAIERAVASVERQMGLINKMSQDSNAEFSAIRTKHYFNYTDGKMSLQDTLEAFEADIRDLMQSYMRGE